MDNPLSSLTSYLAAAGVAVGSTLEGIDGADALLALSVLLALVRLVIDTPRAYRTVKGWFNASD